VTVYVAVVQFDKHASKNAMAEVLVYAIAQIVRNIANMAPQECEAFGVEVVNVRKYDQPNIDQKVRQSHDPVVESFRQQQITIPPRVV
jgi:hypothetical protein